jgi:hypothetical protein
VRRLRGERHALVLRDAFEVLGDRLDRDAAEVEPLAAPDDRGRHLVRLGGREDEPDADRRLLEHLQQRVERLARQPLRLVDDVDLLAAWTGAVGAFSRRSRASSTPPWEAASISTTSRCCPSRMATH